MGFSRQKGFGALSYLAPSHESQILDPAINDSERFFPGSVIQTISKTVTVLVCYDNENSTVKLICNVAEHGIIDGNFHEILKQWRYPECHLRKKLQF